MPDYIKAVAIPSEKGKCNLFIQYLDISGHLFTDLGPQDKAGGVRIPNVDPFKVEFTETLFCLL